MAHDPQLFRLAAERAARYLEQVAERPVAVSAAALAALAAFHQPLPEQGAAGEDILDMLDRLGSPATVASNGPRYFGFVIGGAHPVALAAHCLTLAWDQNVGPRALSPVGAVLEDVAAGWLLELLGLPADCATAFVSGAGMASFTALAAARRALLLRLGWDVDADGLFGAPALRVVVSDEIHPTVLKALGMLGMGRQRVERVPTDAQGRLRVEALPTLDAQTIVCVQAGNIHSGAVDPVPEVCARAAAAGAWVHIDGAIGLWAAASATPQRRALVAGIDQAQSWAVDGHKWLNLPYANGAAFVRDGAALRQAMSLRAPYLLQSGAREPYDTTPELSRRICGADWWAALKALGRHGVAAVVDGCCDLTQELAAGLRAAGWTIPHEVTLNQIAAVPARGTAVEVAAALQAEGTCWVGPSHWQGHDVVRFSLSSMHTLSTDILKVIDVVADLG